MIQITDTFSIEEHELHEEFMRASGPGGQHVNKTESAVQLRFDVRNSPSLAPEVKERFIQLAGSQMTEEGVVIIVARRYRSQLQNRQDARARLFELLRKAATPPKRRRKTKMSVSAKEKRLGAKREHSEKKRLRAPKQRFDE